MPRREPGKRLAGLPRVALVGFWIACFAGASSWAASGCNGWDPRSPFERNAPEVDQALKELDAGQLESAEEALERYLGTGECSDAGIGLPPSVRQKPNGSFDLGLTLFYLGEHFGQRFGDEENGDGGASDPKQEGRRTAFVDCALVIVGAIAGDPKVPLELRARAFYLAGNLEFLRKRYKEAVTHYDAALALVPGLYEEAGGDGIGRDAAHNRAIALRRLRDQEDAGNDAADGDDGADGGDAAEGGDGSDGSGGPDAADGSDGKGDGGDDDDKDSKDAGGDGGQDAGNDAGSGKDAGVPASNEPDAGGADKDRKERPPPPPSTSQDDRMLDQLEQETESYQKQEAKNNANRRRGRIPLEDK